MDKLKQTVRKISWFQSIKHDRSSHSSTHSWFDILGNFEHQPKGGYFGSAHDFRIDNATMIENQINLSPVSDPLHALADKRMVGVEVDSAHRHPPPRCHPETRKSVRDRAKIWLKDSKRHSRLWYIWGPAGEGKSAIAQSIGEEAKKENHLGASIFFSKLRDQADVERVVPTIVAQLATVIPEYASVVSRAFEADPTILEKTCATQFKSLIIDPFQGIVDRHPSAAEHPLLIILDGIDECKDQRAQAEFIQLINEHVRAVPRFPLLWIISSRQQAHLKPLLSDLHCDREDLKMDDPESQQDVEHIIRDAFRRIRHTYETASDTENWPAECDLQRIIEVSSGFFAFGSSIIDFVGDSKAGNPEKQLKTCMEFLGRRNHVSPLQALDLLYRQIMSEIPPESLSITKSVLGMSILYPHHTLPAKTQANFFGLSRDEFIQSFRGLHAVLDMPSAQDAHKYSIQFLHTSFADFLRNPQRSLQFCIDPAQVHFDVALRALQWHTRGKSLAQKELKWVHSENVAKIQKERQVMLRVLRGYSSDVVLMACSNVSEKSATLLLPELENFNFRVLGSVPDGIVRFIPWLHALGPKGQALVHVKTKECPEEHSTKTLSDRRPLDKQSKKLYSESFKTNMFNGNPPHKVVFHLGRAQWRNPKKDARKDMKKNKKKDEERDGDGEKDKKREAGDDGNNCAFALTLTGDPISKFRVASRFAGKLKRNEGKRTSQA